MSFEKRLLIIIGIPLGICLILTVALFFASSDIMKKTNQIAELRGNLLFRLEITESLAVLTRQSQEAKGYEVALRSIMPTRDRLIEFSRDIGTVARQNKIDLNVTLGRENPQSAEGLRQTDFTLSGQGPFENLVNFFKFIEGGRYLILSKMFDFSSQDSFFKLMMTGEVFSL